MFDTKFTYVFNSKEIYDYVWKGLSMLEDETSVVRCDPFDLKISVLFKYSEFSKSVQFCRLFGRRVKVDILRRFDE